MVVILGDGATTSVTGDIGRGEHFRVGKVAVELASAQRRRTAAAYAAIGAEEVETRQTVRP